MIEPILGLSFNVQSQKGTYALLLGSGVSRSADIPTGWEVTLDLVRRLAHMQSEECADREVEWYFAKHGKEPDYSSLLSNIAPTSAAQQQVLRDFFEADEEERAQGRKVPTAAHKAIAQLVASGYVRVIVTTNFDRLLEDALGAIGISPVVVASADAIEGMPPLAHTRCTIIKVHGDYLDHRIKNSPDALATYDAGLNTLLDQIWDEYGLIVCGWSSEYDTALRASIERCKSRRYPTYWVARSELKGTAKTLVTLRSAQVVLSAGADEFFPALAEKVNALEDFARPHPMSVQGAVASLKRYLSEDRYRIQLHELLNEEASNARNAVEALLKGNEYADVDKCFAPFVAKIESAMERFLALLITGSLYADNRQTKSFGDAFQILAGIPNSGSGISAMLGLTRCPALLAVYAVGIAAVISGEYHLLREITYRKTKRPHDEDSQATPERFHTSNVGERGVWNATVFKGATFYVPVNQHLENLFRPSFARQCPNKEEFSLAFDAFEMLWGYLKVEAEQIAERRSVWPSPGTFLWHDWRRYDFIAQASLAADGKNHEWPPLKMGLFGGSPAKLKSAAEAAIALYPEIARYR